MTAPTKINLALGLLALAAATRLALHLLPHPPYNFSPIAAIGLFGAAVFDRRWLALAAPFGALFVSDLFLNNLIYSRYYDGFTLLAPGAAWIYGAFAAVMLLGWLLLRNARTPGRVLVASLAASLLFFTVTNFSVWATGAMYPKTPAGLLACYTAGLPFLQNTVLGDLFFSAALFGAFAWATKRQPALQDA